MSAVRSRWGGLILVVALAAGVLTGGPAHATADRPEDFADPTSSQLAASVRVWQPNGIHVWDPSGSVRALVTETTEDDEAVVTISSDILFEFGSSAIDDAGRSVIEEAVAEIPDGAELEIIGHTDSVGDDGSNQALSEERAETVADVVRAARPDLALTVEGRGEREPVADNAVGGEDDPAGRALNRRVEIRH